MLGAVVAALVRSRATRDLLSHGRWVVRQTHPKALADAQSVAVSAGARVGSLWFLQGDAWAVSILQGPHQHDTDEDCVLDADGSCAACGVWHGPPCSCGGRGFHRAGCPESDSTASPVSPAATKEN